MIDQREMGILLPIFSLPSEEGIGTLGQYAYQWIDFLVQSHVHVWQVLPIGITSYGDSPYQSFSSYAGNPYFIDLEEFVYYHWLTQKEFDTITKTEYIDYETLWQEKYQLLRLAFERSEFSKKDMNIYFKKYWWLEDYATFMALKNHFAGKSHQEWTEAQTKDKLSKELKEKIYPEIIFHIFIQEYFYQQWNKLKSYANKNGIQIIGDIPIFVAGDSVDLWANPQYFLLDSKGNPSVVAGVPPDYFSETGQLWGNPLYNWNAIENDNFEWWINRVHASLALFDIIRIDHFRGFEAFWAIPFGEKTAINGTWIKAPGAKFFQILKQKFPNINIIAEDLGIITDDVKELIHKTGFPGMAILLFAFDNDPKNAYKPNNITKHTIVYTGTHDNDTVLGWCLDPKNREHVDNAIKYWKIQDKTPKNIVTYFIKGALESAAHLAIIPIQDILGLDNSARINIPSTLGNNWRWRLKNIPDQQVIKYIKNLIYDTNRRKK